MKDGKDFQNWRGAEAAQGLRWRAPASSRALTSGLRSYTLCPPRLAFPSEVTAATEEPGTPGSAKPTGTDLHPVAQLLEQWFRMLSCANIYNKRQALFFKEIC